MPHILVAGKIHSAGLDLLTQLEGRGYTHQLVNETSEESYLPFIAEADAVLIRTQPMSASTIAAAPRLRVVSRHGVGYDSVDVQALNARGIPLAIVGDVNSASVAEHAVMQLLAAAKRVLRADKAVRDPYGWDWRNKLEQQEIWGKNLLIIGYGRIGKYLAHMAAGFGMTVRAHDPYLERSGWPAGDVSPMADLKEALGWADFLSIHVPKGDHPLLGAPEFAAMKPGLILSNTSRGGVVDEDALIEALKSGRVAAAGIDVFDNEPPEDGSPFEGFDQVVLSPHVAGLTEEASERMAVISVQNIVDFFEKRISPQVVVNRDEIGR
jgi:D-3-phosphoglycerate dehydrogenase